MVSQYSSLLIIPIFYHINSDCKSLLFYFDSLSVQQGKFMVKYIYSEMRWLMESVGIIAEYNPFHNGHFYHIQKIKEKYPNATLVLVVAGNFTQRGEMAIIDKWKKKEIALKAGIDLVIELPFAFATQSADFFSYGAITILEKMHVDRVIFGSESDSLEELTLIAKTQVENEDFDHLVKVYSKLGANYPTALSNAIFDLTGKKIIAPNDLLGISYIKTIIQNNYHIKAETIERISDFHSTILSPICSATAIREALIKGEEIKSYVPSFTYPYLQDALHFPNDSFPYLKYKVLTEDNLDQYHMVEEGIGQKIKKEILYASCYEELISRIKSKRYTYNRLQRTLNAILCNFTKEKAAGFKNISYIRILGFNEKGRLYLSQIKKEVDVPIISKMSKNKDPMLAFELETTKIYALSLPYLEQIKLVESEYKNKLIKDVNHND